MIHDQIVSFRDDFTEIDADIPDIPPTKSSQLINVIVDSIDLLCNEIRIIKEYHVSRIGLHHSPARKRQRKNNKHRHNQTRITSYLNKT